MNNLLPFLKNRTKEIWRCYVCRDAKYELIGIFRTLEDAADDFLISKHDIEDAISNGSYQKDSGYWFNETLIVDIGIVNSLNVKRGQHKHIETSVAVVQLDVDTFTEIARFHSMYEAYQQTGARNIALCCKGAAKSSGGFKWMYADEYDALDHSDNNNSDFNDDLM